MSDSIKLFLILSGIIIVLAIGFVFVDKGIENEGKVIGTFIYDGYTKCLVEVDGIRYNDYCKNIEGDIVKITIYDNGQATIHI